MGHAIEDTHEEQPTFYLGPPSLEWYRQHKGGFVVDRTQRILLQLVNAPGPITSNSIAEAIGMSSRTVHASMPAVATELKTHGAHLVSHRNLGYYIEVDDPAAYEPYLDKLFINSLRMTVANYDNAARTLYISRKLVASPSGTRVDELCEELSLSRSSIRRPLRMAYRFCESFHLSLDSAAGRGIKVNGAEYLIRLAMTELFETHFHKARIDKVDREYAQWICCDYQERQDIRHAYLKVLRESGWSIRDSSAQRVAMYLIIARNRIRAGMPVSLPERWIESIRSTPFFDVADPIYTELSHGFPGYDVSESERAFLGTFILCNLDVDLTRDMRQAVPLLYDQASGVTSRVIDEVRQRTTLDFSAVSGATEMLRQIMIPLLAGKAYGLDGVDKFDYTNELVYCTSPVCAFLARVFGEAVEHAADMRISESDAPHFASLAAWVLAGVRYDCKPLRIAIADSMGTELARRKGELLKSCYPELIEKFYACELYEVRRLDPRDYDVLLYDNPRNKGINYDCPYASYSLGHQAMDLSAVHDEVLIRAYQVDDLVPATRHLRVIHDFRIESPKRFFQLLALRHAPDEDARWAMEERLTTDDRMLRSGNHSDCAFILDAAREGESCLLELYCLARPMHWNDKKICRILYARLRFDGDMRRVKAHERIFSLLALKPHALERFEANPQACVKELLMESLKVRSDGLVDQNLSFTG